MNKHSYNCKYISPIITFNFVCIYYIENLLGSFRCCCSFCISACLYNSSIRFDASVRISVCPDSFNPSNTSSLV